MSKEKFEELIIKFRWQLGLVLVGVILVGAGILLTQNDFFSSPKVEVLESSETSGEIVVEVAGAIEKPGVYKLSSDARIEDALVAAGGLSEDADRDWLEKSLNRAAKIQDGQKLYIPQQGEVLSAKSGGGNFGLTNFFERADSNLISINKATLSELDTLPEIGRERAKSIIENRPYSTIEELVSKGAIGKSIFEKIKEKISL